MFRGITVYKILKAHKNKITDWLKWPPLKKTQNYNSYEFMLLRSTIIQEKKFLKKLYTDFYKDIKEKIHNNEQKLAFTIIELGSNGGFIKDVIASAVTSDVYFLKNLDLVLSATELPFKESSIDVLLLINVLHHLPESYKFFSEANRCLKKGGKVAMIEPNNSLWGRFIYRNFHHERFDTSSKWEDSKKPNYVNGALPWIIFFRDRRIFEKEFPLLKIKIIKPHTPLRYIISGGISMRQLLPSFTYPFVKSLEILLSPFNKYFGMFLTVELEKV